MLFAIRHKSNQYTMKINYEVPVTERITLETSRNLMQASILVPAIDGGVEVPDMDVEDFSWNEIPEVLV